MPIYEYAFSAKPEAKTEPGQAPAGCPYCRDGFTVRQSIKDARLEVCPQCGAPVERLIFPVGVATPHTAADLKNLGFTKLVRKDKGVYENVTATGDESRYWEADKPGTMPNLKGKITD